MLDAWSVVDEEVGLQPLEVVALVFLVCFALVQPWIGFAGPSGGQRFALLPDDEAQEALDRAVRWDGLTHGQRTAAEVAVGLVGVLALLAGLVAGAAWLAASAACLASVLLASQVRRRGRATVLSAALLRGTTASHRARSATRRRRQRAATALLAASLLGALLSYGSEGFAGLSGNVITGVLVIIATVALIGLVATAEKTFGDEETD